MTKKKKKATSCSYSGCLLKQCLHAKSSAFTAAKKVFSWVKEKLSICNFTKKIRKKDK